MIINWAKQDVIQLQHHDINLVKVHCLQRYTEKKELDLALMKLLECICFLFYGHLPDYVKRQCTPSVITAFSEASRLNGSVVSGVVLGKDSIRLIQAGPNDPA